MDRWPHPHRRMWAVMRSNTNPDKPVRRILLECTDTYFTDWNTGIQRVVRNVANECTAIGAEYGVECKPIVRVGDRFLALPWKPRLGPTAVVLAAPSGRAGGRLWRPGTTCLSLRVLRRVGVRLRKLSLSAVAGAQAHLHAVVLEG